MTSIAFGLGASGDQAALKYGFSGRVDSANGNRGPKRITLSAGTETVNAAPLA
jgi:hypothetical protein